MTLLEQFICAGARQLQSQDDKAWFKVSPEVRWACMWVIQWCYAEIRVQNLKGLPELIAALERKTSLPS